MIIFVIAAFMILAVLGAYPLITRKYWKELIVFGVLLFAGFTLSILWVLGVELPRVTDLITQLFHNVFGMKS